MSDHNFDQTPTLLTVRQFAEKHSAFSQGCLRSLIFLAAPRKISRGDIPGNGLNTAIVRLGRKILINEERFFAWLATRQDKKAA